MSTEVLFPPGSIFVIGPHRLASCQRCGTVVELGFTGQHSDWHGSVDTSATVKLAGPALVRNAEPCAACLVTADWCRESVRTGGEPCCLDCDQIDGHRERNRP